ncbi:MAG TPA: hypothetical protein VN715_13825 [Roseiarcus sp.]|nr:hypothetical protein [Roseiarcus sp.]
MTSRIRFAEASDVYAAFPALELYAPRAAAAVAPLDHARALLGSRRPSTALAYLAHLLPRREAVWWGCQCVSAVLGAAAKNDGLRLTLQWVRDPDETLRRDALAFAEASGLQSSTSWLARAVGHSGGSVAASDQPPAAPNADACALAVNAAVVLAATSAPPPMILPWLRECAEAGVRFAAGEEARVVAPSQKEQTAAR